MKVLTCGALQLQYNETPFYQSNGGTRLGTPYPKPLRVYVWGRANALCPQL